MPNTIAERGGPATELPRPPVWEQPGLMRRLLKDPPPVLDELRRRYGPMVGFGAGPMRMAVIGDPAALRELFAMPTTTFKWGHKFNVLGFFLGEGSMVVSDGDDHRRRRSAVQGAFSRRRLEGWIPTIVERADVGIDRVIADLGGQARRIDLYPVGRRIVLEVVVRTLFGERLLDRADEIGALMQAPQDYLESPAIRQLPHPFPRTARARVRGDRRSLDAIVDGEITDRRRNPSDDPLDVIGVLVREGTLTDAEIRDQVVTLIGAGFDTTSATIAWAVRCLTLTPRLLPRLRAEADDVFGPVGHGTADADAESLRRLDLAGRVVQETLRLHPAGSISPREATADLVVGGHRIPEGTLILWSAYLAGRDPAAWSDPVRFDPDRFVDMDPERKSLADIAWVPFGRGARNCIGFALAQMELTLIVARLVQRLDLAAVTAEEPTPVGMVVNRPRGGAVVRASART